MREMLAGEFEFVIATHVDKAHIHNHIVFNATSFYKQTKFRSVPYKTVGMLRAINDKLCLENGLSVLPEYAHLSSNYQQYQKYRNQNTYKAQIRKRLNFLLEKCQSVEEFQEGARNLGIAVSFEGVHATYQFVGGNQQRKTRAEKLSDDDRFTFNGIKERMSQNQTVISLIEQSILTTFQTSENLSDFQEQLKETCQITWKKNRLGEVVYTLHGMEKINVKEFALNQGVSLEKLIQHFAEKTEPELEEETQTIEELYEQQIKTNVHEVDSPVLLDERVIKEVSSKGLLIAAEHLDGEEGEIFIDANQVDFDKVEKKYLVHLGDQFHYYFMQNDKQSNFFLRGEQLLRQLERKMNIPTEKILLPPHTFQFLSGRGLTIRIDHPKIENLFIPKEYVFIDKVSQSVSVELSKNWNYYFQKEARTGKRKPPMEHIKGADLLKLLKSQSGVLDVKMTRKIRYANRKATLSQTNEYATQLEFLRKHAIHNVPELNQKIERRVENIQQLREKLLLLKEKIGEYNTVSKFLVAVNEYSFILEELQSPFANKTEIRKQYHQELSIYNQAIKELEKRGLSSTIATEKVVDLIKENQLHEKELRQELRQQEQQLQDFQHIKEVLVELREEDIKEQEKERIQSQKSEQEK
ncbi:Relaxase/Mobilisation nuclease domain-containing protein [Pilibacter termitis]|uniref:Relaxase/Mobilisation nuclease domain-containing protein n=2 Tax=Pilibacter termitis TaxID=263852 RepID=A0A1T4KW87_9ENTE|nr:Relaxase/Mobilisation nuclease domain-containing protein [Pilibacter termitis]